MDGEPVMLADIWPSDEEIDQVVSSQSSLISSESLRSYVFTCQRSTNGEPSLLEEKAYSRPYWEGALSGEENWKICPFGYPGDNITTDHLSPSNAILPTSAAGEYLALWGCPKKILIHMLLTGETTSQPREPFANPKLANEMVIEAGEFKQGSLARVEPEGQVVRMWEAIEKYTERKQPLITRGMITAKAPPEIGPLGSPISWGLGDCRRGF